MTSVLSYARPLPATAWRDEERAHQERADSLTAGHRERAARGEKHPVEDFLFTYYSYKPSLLRRWHPGEGVELMEAASSPRATWRGYRPGASPDGLVVDRGAIHTRHAGLFSNIARILRATAGRSGNFGCFGLHEWAMVYRDPSHRHDVPLRLDQAATDAVVEGHELRCTHFDAFRFFTPEAAPRNVAQPTRELQFILEQPGCLHAGMDLYKWAMKLGPLVPGDVLLDAFELARDIRVVDMQASPYDLTDWGYQPIPVETPAGKSAYIRAQRVFATRGQEIRGRLLAVIDGS